MDASPYVGFWSYSRRDNDLDGGGVAQLAQNISNEYELQTGQALEMFVDNRSINWGEEWQKNIDHALDNTVFLIAIITPLYLLSGACRQEFMSFAKHLRAGTSGRVLLPILYSDTPALSDLNLKDPILQIVARTQCQDFRKIRLSDASSSGYRQEVHKMAIRIAGICQK